MKRVTTNDVDFIIENKKSLMKLVPTHRYDTATYDNLFQTNYSFYCIVMGLSQNLSDSRKRAAKMGFDFDLSLDYLVELWFKQQGKCRLTDQLLSFESGSLKDKNPFRASIDRIDNARGYVQGNVRLLTHWANNAKSTWDDQCFHQFIQSSHQLLID